jgi:hypothetical protein
LKNQLTLQLFPNLKNPDLLNEGRRANNANFHLSALEASPQISVKHNLISTYLDFLCHQDHCPYICSLEVSAEPLAQLPEFPERIMVGKEEVEELVVI